MPSATNPSTVAKSNPARSPTLPVPKLKAGSEACRLAETSSSKRPKLHQRSQRMFARCGQARRSRGRRCRQKGGSTPAMSSRQSTPRELKPGVFEKKALESVASGRRQGVIGQRSGGIVCSRIVADRLDRIVVADRRTVVVEGHRVDAAPALPAMAVGPQAARLSVARARVDARIRVFI
jgi:hypothetical protein